MRARRNDTVVSRAVGEDYLVINSVLKQYHILNSVAGRIWALATPERPAREIAAIIAREYRRDIADIEHDVMETLEGLSALQLITLSTENADESND